MSIGNRRVITARLTAPANNDTWATGLSVIDHVQIERIGTIAAADSVGVASISGGTITFGVAGTARDLLVSVQGI